MNGSGRPSSRRLARAASTSGSRSAAARRANRDAARRRRRAQRGALQHERRLAPIDQRAPAARRESLPQQRRRADLAAHEPRAEIGERTEQRLQHRAFDLRLEHQRRTQRRDADQVRPAPRTEHFGRDLRADTRRRPAAPGRAGRGRRGRDRAAARSRPRDRGVAAVARRRARCVPARRGPWPSRRPPASTRSLRVRRPLRHSSPSLTRNSVMRPPHGASTGISIFIDSRMIRFVALGHRRRRPPSRSSTRSR